LRAAALEDRASFGSDQPDFPAAAGRARRDQPYFADDFLPDTSDHMLYCPLD